MCADYIKENMPPTRACLVCECKENSKSNLVFADKAWLCDKCRAALIKVVENNNERQTDA
jgi:hypothetical protein